MEKCQNKHRHLDDNISIKSINACRPVDKEPKTKIIIKNCDI